MAEYENRYGATATHGRGAAVDAGLRSYMLTVYNYMAGGVALTGLVAYVLFTQAITLDPGLAAKSAAGGVYALKRGMYLTQLGATLYASPLKWLVMLAPLGFVMALSFGVNRMSASVVQICFWSFAAIMGVSLSSIFAIYTHQSIAQVFFISAAAFASLSIYGYTTKKDLSGWGTFLFMGLIGIVIAAIVNIFLQSTMMQFVISAIGVLVFAGLTAYDTQRIKDMYYQVAGNAELASKAAVMGALSLYLDFINMFMMLLSLFGSKD